jgi:hypothetical protein
MLDIAKHGLKKLLPEELLKKQRDRKELKLWESQGKPAPTPHIIKENAILEYASKFHRRVLIETGTYKGDMVQAMKKYFDRIVSFELDVQLHEQATKRFSEDRTVLIVQGDSGQILGQQLAAFSEPCLFWLDGHYSGGVTAKASLNTPIIKELEQIFAHPIEDHVILVDDARCFDGTNDYPTLEALEHYIRSIRPNWEFAVRDDIIRICQRQ